MPPIRYTKPPTTYEQQLAQLKARGLLISSDRKALHLLEKIGYYRLSGYWYPLLEEPKNAHKFKPGQDFQTAFKIYRFDRDLRIFILKELEKIEIAFRAKLVNTFSHYRGAFWHTDASIVIKTRVHEDCLQKMSSAFEKSDEDFVISFRQNYNEPLPPSWMMLELTSFGAISVIYRNLRSGRSKRDVAHHFGLDDSTLTSWLHCFVYIRNVCAHHARLWNRGMSIKPQIPLNPAKQWLNDTSVANNKTYFILSMMLYLLQSIDTKHQFVFRLKILLKKYPNIDISAMGFPSSWETEPLWQFRPTIKQRIRLLLAYKAK